MENVRYPRRFSMEGHSNVSFLKVSVIFLLFGASNSRSIHPTPSLNRSEENRILWGVPGYVYFFPWSCWITPPKKDDTKTPGGTGIIYWPAPIGMCSILNKKYVFGGVDNLRFIKNLRDLYVWTGVDSPGDPSGFDLEEYGQSAQTMKVKSAYIALGPEIKGYSEDLAKPDIEWDVTGAAMNIALFAIEGEFTWGAYVMPIPLPHDSIRTIKERTRKMVNFLDRHPHSRSPCSIATYGPIRSTVFTQVSYVPREVCKSIYCSVDLGYCFKFPFQWYHVCFRAVAFNDPCMYDQGAALYCNWWDKSIFAILSQVDNCGIDGLPAVYTLMAAPLQLWELVVAKGGDDFALRHFPFGRKDNFSQYTLKPGVPTPTVYNYEWTGN